MAHKNWEKLGIPSQINSHYGKAEELLPKLFIQYDFIFFDGYAPSMKFLIHFERLLKKGGLLVTANLFLKDPKGGKYVRAVQNTRRWQSEFFADSVISVKLF